MQQQLALLALAVVTAGAAADVAGLVVTCGQCAEEECTSLSLRCRRGEFISAVRSASFGSPRTGACGNWGGQESFREANCTPTPRDMEEAVAVVRAVCVGRASCTVPSDWRLFGDPCPHRPKTLAVEVACTANVLLQRDAQCAAGRADPAVRALCSGWATSWTAADCRAHGCCWDPVHGGAGHAVWCYAASRSDRGPLPTAATPHAPTTEGCAAPAPRKALPCRGTATEGSAARLFVGEVAAWYRQYGADLDKVRLRVHAMCVETNQCHSEELELELSYLRIRHHQPKVIYEISPFHGYSSLFLLSAVKDNGFGRVISFDLVNLSVKNIPTDLQEFHTFVLGDAQKHHRNFPTADYLFLDSFHSKQFGQFYTDDLFVRHNDKHVLVSMHDVYNPKMWSAPHPARNLELFPEWMPTEEGMWVLPWLAFHKEHCGVFTVAPSCPYFQSLHEDIKAVRKPWIHSRSPHTRGANMDTHVDGVNPTLFFELNCHLHDSAVVDEKHGGGGGVMAVSEKKWREGFKYEIAFWDNWVKAKGGIYADDFATRLRPDAPFYYSNNLKSAAATGQKHFTALSVGAGPLERAGYRISPTVGLGAGAHLELISTDPLAKV